jgi:novel protein kinase C epsilon type
MNVHKRCQKNVANNCGINPKQIALLLEQLGVADNSSQSSLSSQNLKSTKNVFNRLIEKKKLNFENIF